MCQFPAFIFQPKIMLPQNEAVLTSHEKSKEEYRLE
jgi:hypothetical protein